MILRSDGSLNKRQGRGNEGEMRGRVCARSVARSENVTVYREIRVYAETQVHRTRWTGKRK